MLTSQGVPFIFAGDEVMRDKQGVHNSYNSPDSINAIRWELKRENRDVFDYVCGLVKMRRAHPAFRLGDAGLVREHLEFLPDTEDNVVAFRLKGQPAGDAWKDITVILNARDRATQVSLPAGTWQVVCRDGRISPDRALGTVQGGPADCAPITSGQSFAEARTILRKAPDNPSQRRGIVFSSDSGKKSMNFQ